MSWSVPDRCGKVSCQLGNPAGRPDLGGDCGIKGCVGSLGVVWFSSWIWETRRVGWESAAAGLKTKPWRHRTRI